jgi:hypothetical protein
VHVVWQSRIDAPSIGLIQLCGTSRLQILKSNNVYRAQADLFTFGRGWSSGTDVAATDGKSAKASSGTPPPNGAYGDDFVPAPRAYDIWYRVRVSAPSSGRPEMTLTLTDVTASRYMAAATFSAGQAGSAYSWLRVAANVTPTSGHSMRFQANVLAGLSTDWYIDAAVMVPAGAPVPGG